MYVNDRQNFLVFSSNNKGSQESISELIEDPPVSALKTFHAKTVQSLSDCEIPASSEFRPIQSLSEQEGYQSSSEVEKLLAKLNRSDNNIAANNIKTGNKKKRRRKKKTVELKKDPADKIEDNEEDIDASKSTNDENNILTCDQSENNSIKVSNDYFIFEIKLREVFIEFPFCLFQKDESFDDEIDNIEIQSQNSPPITTDLHFFSDTDVTCRFVRMINNFFPL